MGKIKIKKKRISARKCCYEKLPGLEVQEPLQTLKRKQRCVINRLNIHNAVSTLIHLIFH